ncbi:hypothetical protein AMECASPLE_010604 [Ameca splendens]|uniref:Uncharacterized protein n=1 Tax=Ameca splendens TaxID=208324 RepID=A0ABV0ZWF2_9TELE
MLTGLLTINDTSFVHSQQYEEAQMELSDLKERSEKTEQEKQGLEDQLEEFKANMKDLQEKGSKTPQLLPVQAIVIGLILALLFWCFGAMW